MPSDATPPEVQPDGGYAEYFAGGYTKVRGWLASRGAAGLKAVLTFQERRGVTGTIAEIGTFHGKTFVGLGLAVRPQETLVGVDLFVHLGTDFEPILRRNCATFGVDPDRFRLHRGPSTDLGIPEWRELLGPPARLVHVDGSHQYAPALHDLKLAASHLAPGGAILVDDILSVVCPDVTTAAIDFLREHSDFRAVALFDRDGRIGRGGAKLLMAAAQDEDAYVKALAFAFRPARAVRRPFATSRPLVF
ncbi:class I SAM-dependent methyltransferase [Roseomonas fluvialis]|uniref:Class I SAM-dependent methyltransferase n=1 Tax=Roseomonas fluvialis TaxID=1750527 RepID=A0ABM7Y432_9PROT|nr:class I SAM-dependent methyltransferase [Roseomonas fluvialis]BDG72866.1 hypothetical protein Rmf_27950 [Roseomonas fluvialis]